MNPKILAVMLLVIVLVVAGKIFLQRKPSLPADLNLGMTELAKDAVEAANKNYGVELNYGTDSIRKVEQILGKLHVEHTRSAFTEQRLHSEAYGWGAYIGEVIKGQMSARWETDSAGVGKGALPLVFTDKSETFPCRWVLKRIQNGSEDDVWKKFQILILQRGQTNNALEVRPLKSP